MTITFRNAGQAAAVFQVRSGSGTDGPWTFTVGAGDSGTQSWPVTGGYDLSVYGPNGFYRRFAGTVAGTNPANLTVNSTYETECAAVRLDISNSGGAVSRVQITSAYRDEEVRRDLPPGQSFSRRFSLEESSGWYDLSITVESDPAFNQQLAGHVETGRDSTTDPLIGAGKPGG